MQQGQASTVYKLALLLLPKALLHYWPVAACEWNISDSNAWLKLQAYRWHQIQPIAAEATKATSKREFKQLPKHFRKMIVDGEIWGFVARIIEIGYLQLKFPDQLHLPPRLLWHSFFLLLFYLLG